MILKQLVSDLDRIFQKELALEWDKAGLQAGNGANRVDRILVTLDVDDAVVDEAIASGSTLIISHHPVLFEELAAITDSTAAGRRMLRLIENRIAVYSAHTNYDIMEGGLNDHIAGKLGLKDQAIIAAETENWYKFVVFVPEGSQEEVREAMCRAGGGKLGDYSCCTFRSPGTGTFLPGTDASPYIGRSGRLSQVKEMRMECITPRTSLDRLVDSVIEAHPYEEPAYDIYRLENRMGRTGPGRTGRLEDPLTLGEYIRTIKEDLDTDEVGVFCQGPEDTGSRTVEKVALVAGSCNSLTGVLAGLDCDLVVTGEISYHNAVSLWESGKPVAALGHGSLEKQAIGGICNLLNDYIEKNKLDLKIEKTRWGYWDWRYDIGKR